MKPVSPTKYTLLSLYKLMYGRNRIKMVVGNLEEGFTVFQFLENQTCLRVCHLHTYSTTTTTTNTPWLYSPCRTLASFTPTLPCDKLYFVLYSVRRNVKLLTLPCVSFPFSLKLLFFYVSEH